MPIGGSRRESPEPRDGCSPSRARGSAPKGNRRRANGDPDGPGSHPPRRQRMTSTQPDPIQHARGSGAFGRFGVTGDVSACTKAAVFQPGTTTRLVTRFPPWPGSAAAPTWGGTCAASRSSSALMRATRPSRQRHAGFRLSAFGIRESAGTDSRGKGDLRRLLGPSPVPGVRAAHPADLRDLGRPDRAEAPSAAMTRPCTGGA
jgi:hypothetical protein